MSRYDATEKPRLKGDLLRTADPGLRDLLKQIDRWNGVGSQIPTTSGGLAGFRVDTAARRFQINSDGKWWDVDIGESTATPQSSRGISGISGLDPIDVVPDTGQIVLRFLGSLAVDASGNLYVVNDSHTHTGATLSGIDISSDTNLAASLPLLLTGDTLSLDYDTSSLQLTADKLDVKDDGHAHTGSTLSDIAAGDLTAALAALIQGTPTFTIGSQSGSVRNVSVQLKDVAGTNLATETACLTWLSTSAKGAVAPGPVIFSATTGVLLAYSAGNIATLVSNSSGVFAVDVDGAGTYYLNIECQGTVHSSSAIVIS